MAPVKLSVVSITYLFLKDTEIFRSRHRLFYLYYLKLFAFLDKNSYYTNSLNRRITKSKGNASLKFWGFLFVSIVQEIPTMIPVETFFSVKTKTPKSKQHRMLTNPPPHFFVIIPIFFLRSFRKLIYMRLPILLFQSINNLFANEQTRNPSC